MKNHLGNGRVFFSDMNKDGIVEVAQNGNANELLQQEHYYPFGMGIRDEWKFVQPQIGGVNAYQYNGKELNEDYGLNWNDYGARWYDASIARWNAVDPLAEVARKESPYIYVSNNPILMNDPTGMIGEKSTEDLLNEVWDKTPDDGKAHSYDNNGNEIENNTGEKEDCCPGKDRLIDMQTIMGQAADAGKDPKKAWDEFKENTNDTEIGEALGDAMFYAGTWYLGGVAVKLVFRGGSLLFVAAQGGKVMKEIPKIVSFGQNGLRNPAAVESLKQSMLNGSFEYGAQRGMISGWLNNGRYIIGEGHHRMAAAIEILKETGNAVPVLNLLKNGVWSTAQYAPKTRALPSRSAWGKFINWLGF